MNLNLKYINNIIKNYLFINKTKRMKKKITDENL